MTAETHMIASRKLAKFEPVTLSITLENEEAVWALHELAGYDSSIPALIREKGGEHHSGIRTILQKLRTTLEPFV